MTTYHGIQSARCYQDRCGYETHNPTDLELWNDLASCPGDKHDHDAASVSLWESEHTGLRIIREAKDGTIEEQDVVLDSEQLGYLVVAEGTLMFLTVCCLATAKGGDGAVCRSCYEPINDLAGWAVRVDDPDAVASLTSVLRSAVDADPFDRHTKPEEIDAMAARAVAQARGEDVAPLCTRSGHGPMDGPYPGTPIVTGRSGEQVPAEWFRCTYGGCYNGAARPARVLENA